MKKVKYLVGIILFTILTNPLRLLVLSSLITLHYFLNATFIRSQDPLLITLIRLINFFDGIVRKISLLPIRNKMILTLKEMYIQAVNLKNISQYDKADYGKVFARLRRVEYIVSGIERDLFSTFKYLPLVFLYTSQLTKREPKFLYVFLLFNLICILMTKNWISLRKKTFQSDDEVNIHLHSLFNNLNRSIPNFLILDKFKEDNMFYNKSLTFKFGYKLCLGMINTFLVLVAYYYSFISKELLVDLLMLIIYHAHFFFAILSIIGLLHGLPFPEKTYANKIQKNIIIKNLTIPGVFYNVNIDIEYGSKIALIGPNGSGKTLLLRIIAGLEAGYLDTDFSASLVEENASPFKHDLDQFEKNLISNPEMQRYKFLLEKKRLSRGEKLFIVIVSTILNSDKDILLLDEAMDPISNEMLDDLSKLIKLSNSTIIVATHREEVIKMFKERIIISGQKVTKNSI